MPNFIENLNEHNMQCIMVTAGLPSDDRVVHIYDIDSSEKIPICAPARYMKDKWIGALTGNILEGLSDKACWGESVFSTAESVGKISNITGERIWED